MTAAQVLAVAMGDPPHEGAAFTLGDVLFSVEAVPVEHLPLAESGPGAGNLGELRNGGEIVFLEFVDDLSDGRWAFF